MNHFDLDFSGWTAKDFKYTSTREDWAERLGISAKTLQRYETEILYRDISKMPHNSSIRLTQAFYWRNRRNRTKLDYYQKFILWIIQKLSFGEAYANQKLSYDQIQDWFNGIHEVTGKERILMLSPPLVRKMLDV